MSTKLSTRCTKSSGSAFVGIVFLQRTRQNAEGTAGIPLRRLPSAKLRRPRSNVLASLYTLSIDFAAVGKTRTEVMLELRENGVGTQVLYIPVHLQPWYRNTYGYAVGKCPIAEELYLRSLSFPLYPTMSNSDVEKVIREIRNCVG